jgi:5-methylcytosine-specific restriction endonuclease McrA
MAKPHRRPSSFAVREGMRKKLYNDQKGMCHLCGLPMTIHRRDGVKNIPPSFATFDHIIPASEGGIAHISNLRLAHRRCNNGRNSRPLIEIAYEADAGEREETCD